MIRILIVLTLMLMAGGCSTLIDAQVDLVDQASQGTQLLRETIADQAQQVDDNASFRRAELDRAFDTDVREQASLSPDWVIEHRQMYQAGLDVLEQSHASAREQARVAMSNLDATQASLDKLRRLLSIQQRWSQLEKQR